jgi:hypothetical protein
MQLMTDFCILQGCSWYIYPISNRDIEKFANLSLKPCPCDLVSLALASIERMKTLMERRYLTNDILLFIAGFLAGGWIIEIRIEKKPSRNDLLVKPAHKLKEQR